MDQLNLVRSQSISYFLVVTLAHTERSTDILEIPPNFTIDFGNANIGVLEGLGQSVHLVSARLVLSTDSFVFKPRQIWFGFKANST